MVALDLAVGLGFGAAITVLSREWTIASRLIVLALSLLGGVIVFVFSTESDSTPQPRRLVVSPRLASPPAPFLKPRLPSDRPLAQDFFRLK